MPTEVLNKATGYDGGVIAAGGITDLTLSRMKAVRAADAHGRYFAPTIEGRVFTLALNATTTGVAAGNIVAAAAAASTQFALWNPANSSVNVALLKFGMGIISGTPGGGPLFHGIMFGVPTIASTGTLYNNLLSSKVGQAKFMASAAGAALTGGVAPVVFRPSAFSSTATAQASVGELNAVEEIAGEIILPPGTGWVPLWSAAGTAVLNAYSITFEEVPL